MSELLEKRNRREVEEEIEEKCVRLRLDIFSKYWNILKSNYKDAQHTEFDFKYYYSIFREYEEKDFINAIKMVLKYQSFFPRVDEIVKYLPRIDDLAEPIPEWFGKEMTLDEMTEEEKEKMEEILKGIGGSK